MTTAYIVFKTKKDARAAANEAKGYRPSILTENRNWVTLVLNGKYDKELFNSLAQKYNGQYQAAENVDRLSGAGAE